MGRYPIEIVHISDVRVGDTVLHQDQEMTVCQNNLRKDGFMGHLLFGDSYRLGTQLVKRLKIDRALP